MAILASFNYYGPSTGAIVIGAGLAIAILVALACSRSAMASCLLGAYSWGIIAFFVFGSSSEEGDMTGIMQMASGVFFGIAGAVAGLIAGGIGHRAIDARWPMPIERSWLRIIVAVVGGGIASVVFANVVRYLIFPVGGARIAWFFSYIALLVGPTFAALLVNALTPREKKDGHTRCGKCGYILKGLTEPRCSECGERI